MRDDLITALLALQVATGHKAEHMTPQMREAGEIALAEFKNNGQLRSRLATAPQPLKPDN